MTARFWGEHSRVASRRVHAGGGLWLIADQCAQVSTSASIVELVCAWGVTSSSSSRRRRRRRRRHEKGKERTKKKKKGVTSGASVGDCRAALGGVAKRWRDRRQGQDVDEVESEDDDGDESITIGRPQCRCNTCAIPPPAPLLGSKYLPPASQAPVPVRGCMPLLPR